MKVKQSFFLFALLLLTAATALAATPTLAAAPNGVPTKQFHQGGPRGERGQMPGKRPGVMGTVTAINGTGLTITGRQGFGTSSPSVTYAIDASGATVIKAGTTSTVASIAVSDVVEVQGTVNGTNVIATIIRDGLNGLPGQKKGSPHTTTTLPIKGDGKPVIAGTVSAVNGTSLTVNTNSGLNYTVDGSDARIIKGQTTPITVSDIQTGDTVIVQGSVNGTTIIATSIFDQSENHKTDLVTPTANPNSNGANAPASNPGAGHKVLGFIGQLGGFFKHLFGF